MSFTKKTITTITPYTSGPSIYGVMSELTSVIERLVSEGKTDSDPANAGNYTSNPPLTTYFDPSVTGLVKRTIVGNVCTWERHWVDSASAQEWVDAQAAVYSRNTDKFTVLENSIQDI